MRELAARGRLTWDASDQLELLVFLLDDHDSGVAGLANATLDAIPRAVLEALLARSDVTPELRAVFAGRGVEPGPVPAPDDAPAPVPAEVAPARDRTALQPQLLASLPITDRIKLAINGTRQQRAVLLRDPNKVVAMAVLGSPKLNVTEVAAYAQMTSVQEELLRVIGTSRHWTKHYPIAAALVSNPKTPIGIAMSLVSRLNERDLKLIARDRGVAEGVRASARKFLSTGQARRH